MGAVAALVGTVGAAVILTAGSASATPQAGNVFIGGPWSNCQAIADSVNSHNGWTPSGPNWDYCGGANGQYLWERVTS